MSGPVDPPDLRTDTAARVAYILDLRRRLAEGLAEDAAALRLAPDPERSRWRWLAIAGICGELAFWEGPAEAWSRP